MKKAVDAVGPGAFREQCAGIDAAVGFIKPWEMLFQLTSTACDC